MKTIVCYGDSITWGYIPGNFGRFPLHQRWPSVLQNTLGEGYHVIAEGLTGRYTVHDEAFRTGRNGAALLQPILESHAPVDLLILLLGTNDILHHAELTAFEAARGVEVLARIAQTSETGPGNAAPAVMIIAPPHIRTLSRELARMYRGNPVNSEAFAGYYKEIADLHNGYFINAAEIVEASDVDGVHLDEYAQSVLGKAVAAEVRKIFP